MGDGRKIGEKNNKELINENDKNFKKKTNGESIGENDKNFKKKTNGESVDENNKIKKNYINNIDKELNTLTSNNKNINLKIKMISTQATPGYIGDYLNSYFRCTYDKLFNLGDFNCSYKLFAIKNDFKEYENITFLSKNGNNIIAKQTFYFNLFIVDGDNQKILLLNLCDIEIDLTFDFTDNKVEINYKLKYLQLYYKYIIYDLPIELQKKEYTEIIKKSEYLGKKEYNENLRELLCKIFNIFFNGINIKDIKKQDDIYKDIFKIFNDENKNKKYIDKFNDLIKFIKDIKNFDLDYDRIIINDYLNDYIYDQILAINILKDDIIEEYNIKVNKNKKELQISVKKDLKKKESLISIIDVN